MGEILDEVNDLGIEEARMLDFLALVCDGCDWWFARHEITDTGTRYFCPQCLKEHNDG